MNQGELSEQEETILLLGQVISHFPYKTFEVTSDAYIDAITEINNMTCSQKRSFVREMVAMMNRTQNMESCTRDNES